MKRAGFLFTPSIYWMNELVFKYMIHGMLKKKDYPFKKEEEERLMIIKFQIHSV